MRGCRWGLRLLAFFVVLFGAGLASGLSGALVVSGDLTLPPASWEVEAPLALRVAPDAPLDELHLTAARLTVTRHEWRIHDVTLGDRRVSYVLDHQVASYPLTDATVSLVEGSRAHGLAFLHANAPATLTIASELTVAGRAPHTFGDDAVSMRGDEDPRRPDVSFAAPTLEADADRLVLDGHVVLHLFGPHVSLSAAENVSSVDTGSDGSGAPVERVERALVIEADGALLLSGALELRLRSLTGTSRGVVAADAASGSIYEEDATYVASGTPTVLQGRLNATVSALGEGTLELAVADGALEASTLSRLAGAPRESLVGGAAWGAPLLLGFCLALGAALAVHRRARKRASDADAESLMWRAEEAIEAGRLAQALDLLEDAARRAPNSTRIRFDLAYLRWRTGKPEAALALLHDLASSPERSEALLLSARIHAKTGAEDLAAATLVRLLDEAPIMLLEIEDEQLANVLPRPDVAAAMRRARRALGQ